MTAPDPTAEGLHGGVVVMGVSGSGKSSVGAALAARLGMAWVDGDMLHSAEAVAKMRAGAPLDDADRIPWLDRVGARLAEGAQAEGVVVACSALKRAYRDRIRAAAPGVRFLFLDGDPTLIAARLTTRRSHYMPASLLQSQLRTLETPGEDEAGVLRVSIDASVDAIVIEASARLAVC